MSVDDAAAGGRSVALRRLGDDTGPRGPPMGFVNNGNMLAFYGRRFMRTNGPVGTEVSPDGLAGSLPRIELTRVFIKWPRQWENIWSAFAD